MVAVEPGRNLLRHGRLSKQISGQLFNGELIKRHIGIEGIDDPVAVSKHSPRPVVLVAVGIRIASGIQPVSRHVFAVVRRLQQSIHHRGPGRLGLVLQERIQLFEGGRQAGQIQGNFPQPFVFCGFRRVREALLLQTPQDKVVDRIPGPVAVHVGDRRSDGRDKRPVLFPRGAFFNPRSQCGFFGGRQAASGFWWWHHHIGVVRKNSFDDQTLGRAAWDDRRRSVAVCGRGCLLVEPQVSFSRSGVRAVTVKTLVRQNGPDVPIEADIFSCRCSLQRDQQATDAQQPRDPAGPVCRLRGGFCRTL